MDLQPKTAYTGFIKSWHDKNGFGFIQIDGQREVIFFHITAFAYEHFRPQLGQRVVCLVQWNERKKAWNATRVLLEEHQNSLHREGVYDFDNVYEGVFGIILFSTLILSYYVILSWVLWPLALSSIIISGAAFHLYRKDKWNALSRKKFRIPEGDLFLVSMLGGWPGAIIARHFYRHKISKSRFTIFFWACMVINTVIFYYLINYKIFRN